VAVDPPQPAPRGGGRDAEAIATDERGQVALEDGDRGNVEAPGGDGTHAARHRRRRQVHDVRSVLAQRVLDLPRRQRDRERAVHRERHRGDAHDGRARVLGGPVARRNDHGVMTAIPEVLQDAKHRVRHAIDLRKEALGDDADLHDAQHDDSRSKRLGRATNTTSRSRSATVNETRHRDAGKRSPLVHPVADRDATRRSTVDGGNREVRPMTIPAPSFRCELHRDHGDTAVVVDGELEEISAVQLAAACLHARDVAGDVVLDLGGLSFADGTGIRMLETIRRAFVRSGHRLSVVHPSRRVRSEIERLGLDGVLSVERETAEGPVPVALTG
jgi:anti-anti-sigma factor